MLIHVVVVFILFRIDQKSQSSICTLKSDNFNTLSHSMEKCMYIQYISQFFSQKGVQSSPSEHSFASICYEKVVITSYKWCLFPLENIHVCVVAIVQLVGIFTPYKG